MKLTCRNGNQKGIIIVNASRRVIGKMDEQLKYQMRIGMAHNTQGELG